MGGNVASGAIVAAALVLAVANDARAQQPNATKANDVSTGESTTSDAWYAGRTRAFVGGQFGAGASGEARLIVGYGKPHWTWAGVELGALSTTQMGLSFVRARLALLLIDLAVTWRRTWSYARTAPMHQDSYTDADLDGSPKARYSSIDLWAWGLAPVPLGLIDWELEAVYTYDIARGRDLYEEYLRAVTQPGWLAVARLGYEFLFADRRGTLGPMIEAMWLSDRGTLWRMGPDFSWTFSTEWDVAIRLTATVVSPDELGLFNGLGGSARLRYRWATGR